MSRTTLDRSEVQTLDDLALTTAARAILDLAPGLDGRSLRRLVEQAQDRAGLTPEDLRAALERRPGRPGSPALRDLVDLMTPDAEAARSHLERLFLRLVRRARLPPPRVNVPVGPRTPDFIWPDARLAVEVDGARWHATKQALWRDRRRDRGLTAEGWRPVRFTYQEIAFEPAAVALELRALPRIT